MDKKYIAIVIYNDVGEIALQQRAAADVRDPLHWDFSVGGHIEPDEDPLGAAHRELYEELGVEGQLIPYGIECFRSRSMHHMFGCLHSGPFRVDPVEVAGMKYFSLSQIQDMMDGNDLITPPFRDFWERKIIHRMHHAVKI